MIDLVRSWLAHPMTRGLDLDDPATTEQRRRIILEKRFLERIYLEWYGCIRAALPRIPGPVLEVGSGAGFLKKALPDLVTSDILPVSGVDVVLDGTALPFKTGSLRAIVMVNVFHHLKAPRAFMAEALRCTRQGGRVICVEPWLSPWASLVMRMLHHERFDRNAAWETNGTGALSDANGALPWIVFERDRGRFQEEFPQWEAEIRRIGMPFCYLLSGGVSSRVSAPEWSFSPVRRLERVITARTSLLDMFATVVLTRR